MRIISKSFFSVVILAFCWGPSWQMLKFALSEMPPITIVATRVLLAAIILQIFCYCCGIALPRKPKIWLHGIIISMLSCSIPFLAGVYSMIYIPSIWGGLIVGIMPIVTVVASHFFLDHEKLTLGKLLGISLGFAGLLVLFLPTILDGDFGDDSLGILICAIMPVSYAAGNIYARKYLQGVSIFMAPTMHLSIASIYLVPMSLLMEQSWQLPLPSVSVGLSILGLTIFSTALAFVLYFKIIASSGATAVSMVSYLVPIVSTVTGIVFLHEKLSMEFCMSGALVILSLLAVNRANGAVKNEMSRSC